MPEREIPLRLNRRRDGSLCLVDALGRASGPEREFPGVHVFTYEWIATAEGAKFEGDNIVLNFANGTATYEIVERGGAAVRAKLVSSELTDPAPIDESKVAAPSETAGRAESSTANAGSIHIGAPISAEEVS